MIYIDTSVLLARMLSEDRQPPLWIWDETLVSSRLLEYEVWNRLHSRNLSKSHGELARRLIGRISLLELSPVALARALDPFPVSVRALDAIHLASLHFLSVRNQDVHLLSYDQRMLYGAKAMGLHVLDPMM